MASRTQIGEATPTTGYAVAVLLCQGSQHFLLVRRRGARLPWALVSINTSGGELVYTDTENLDAFGSEADALGALEQRHGPVELLGVGEALLGYVVIGATGLALVAEKTRPGGHLPGGHSVRCVTAAGWHRLVLRGPGASQREPDDGAREEAARNVERLTTFPIDGAHFYCETFDVTRPFPSPRPVFEPSWDFVWNRWLGSSVRGLPGMRGVVPSLMQGLCQSRDLVDDEGSPYQLVLLSKRSCMHAGPRFKARGLNALNEPANEIECEQLVWRERVAGAGAPSSAVGSGGSGNISGTACSAGVDSANGNASSGAAAAAGGGASNGSGGASGGAAAAAGGGASNGSAEAAAAGEVGGNHNGASIGNGSNGSSGAAAAVGGMEHVWSRYAWRRGSVPLWWRTKIKNSGMGMPDIRIQKDNTFAGARCYVRRLQRRFQPTGVDAGTLAGGGSAAAAAAAVSPLAAGAPPPAAASAALSQRSAAATDAATDSAAGSESAAAAADAATDSAAGADSAAAAAGDAATGSADPAAGRPGAAAGKKTAGKKPRGGSGRRGKGAAAAPAGGGRAGGAAGEGAVAARGSGAEEPGRPGDGPASAPSAAAAAAAARVSIAADATAAAAAAPAAVQQQRRQPCSSSRGAAINVPVVFVSLLRQGVAGMEKDGSEAMLGAVFEGMLCALRKEHKLPLGYVALDWHELDRRLGHEGSARAFWREVSDMLPSHGFTAGAVALAQASSTSTNAVGVGSHTVWREQRGLMRYNCADSLDRTNVSSFFGAVQVLVEQCRELGLSIVSAPPPPPAGGSPPANGAPPLPGGLLGGSASVGGGVVGGAASRSRGHSRRSKSSAAVSAGAFLEGGGGAISSSGDGSSCASPPPPPFRAARSVSAFERLGKELNRGLQSLVQDLKPPNSGGGSSSSRQQQHLGSTASAPPVLGPSPHTRAKMAKGLTPQLAQQLAACGPLPSHIEAKVDPASNRLFFVDHINKTTSWEPPRGDGHGNGGSGASSDLPPPPPMPPPQLGSDSPPGCVEGGGVDGGVDRGVDGGVERMLHGECAAETPPGSPHAAGRAGAGVDGGAAASGSQQRAMQGQQGQQAQQQGQQAQQQGQASAQQGAGMGSQQQQGQQAQQQAQQQQQQQEQQGAQQQQQQAQGAPAAAAVPPPWSLLGCDAATFAARVRRDALSASAELFMVSGDMNAWLYTGSQALHTERILIFEPEGSQLRRAGTGAYAALVVGLKRRFNNLWVDEDRQLQMDVFLGLKQEVYFTRAPLTYTSEPPPPADFADSDDGGDAVGRLRWDDVLSGATQQAAEQECGGDGEPATPSVTPADLGGGVEATEGGGGGRATGGANGKDLFAQMNRDLLSQVNGMFRAWGK
ncbi:hypothetical protein FOA52_015066 [Chlamydomonas sp. UWO 241]|nr:hypothetical protein FOA52_015066 [Chlamydomonas sp. UWO 241]